ncbi:MAG TPA: hypothetical protein DEA28_01105 [Firmicutes bacterium]|nr:hypothetical protein [Bacillota bacterium]
MVKREKINGKTYCFYEDSSKDDFMKTNLPRPEVPLNYKYIRNNPINVFFSNILYYLIAKPILGLYCILRGVKVKNRKNLKEVRKKGCFIYANHTSIFDMFDIQSLVIRGKRTYLIGYSDMTSVPIAVNICNALGYLPLPLNDFRCARKFLDSLDYYVNKKHQNVLIYPEAHVWPFYTKIRDFPSASFHYPAKLNAPVIPIVTTYRKVLFFKKPRLTINVGRVIYPKEGATIKENRDYLYNECYKQMVNISSSVKQPNYFKYVKTLKEN